MGLFRAKYEGVCSVCKRKFSQGGLIFAERGKPPTHAQCKGRAPKEAADPGISAAQVEAERKNLNRVLAQRRWLAENPRPDFDEEIGKRGGPVKPQYVEGTTDEEWRWYQATYQTQLQEWLRANPELAAQREAALATWETRRREHEQQHSGSSSSGNSRNPDPGRKS